MKVNISFNFDSITKEITDMKVLELDKKSPSFDGDFVVYKGSQLFIPQSVIDYLDLKPYDKIYLCIEGDVEFELSLTNIKSQTNHQYVLTGKNTINVRGRNAQIISSFGSQFSLKVDEEGRIALIAVQTGF